MSETQIPDTEAGVPPKEQAILRGFQAMRRHVRAHGMTPEVEAIATWLPHVANQAARGEMARFLGYYWFRKGDTGEAIRFSDMASALLPSDTDAAGNALRALAAAGQWEDVIVRAKAAIVRYGDRYCWHRMLAEAHGKAGDLAAARRHGTIALGLRDAACTGPVHDVSGVPVPRFAAARPERNAIAFSLFGDNEKYIRTAILNARAARFLYIGWTATFYVDDSVPLPVLQALAGEGARLLKIQGLPADPFGPFWRFLIAGSPGIDRYLIRDAGSVVNTREFVAVQEWLDSDMHFHVMRDHPGHADLVMAGMWGGVRGALPPLGPWIGRYMAERDCIGGGKADQAFLNDQLWPTIRTSVLTHDSQFSFGTWCDFPSAGRLPPNCHVGCDGRALLTAGAVRSLAA